MKKRVPTASRDNAQRKYSPAALAMIGFISLATGSVAVYPTSAEAVAAVKGSFIRDQVEQKLAAVQQQPFVTDAAKQLATIKALESVTAGALKASVLPPFEILSGIVTTATAAHIPSPIVVATVERSAFSVASDSQLVVNAVTSSAVEAGGDAGAAAAATIVTALGAHVRESLIGAGLGQSAAMLSGNDPAAAAAIARAVADEGTVTIIAAFSKSVADAGGSAQLVAIASGPPLAAGATGTGNQGNGNGNGGGNGNNPGHGNCHNPSCN